MTERLALSTRLQAITHDPYGHFLNHRQIFSPDGARVYFDTRNADPEIQRTCRIESIDWRSGEVSIEYTVPRPSEYGPGVGAVVCHPHRERLLFIHGLHSCNQARPYGTTRRFGALLATESSRSRTSASSGSVRMLLPIESRYVTSDCPRGGLRGGTHAHSWSRDGRWVSFTYNDDVVAMRHACGEGPPDRRTVGAIYLPDLDADYGGSAGKRGLAYYDCAGSQEEWSGLGWGTVLARVTDAPRFGSDDIEQACEECWVENRPLRTMAFLGRVRDARGHAIDEVYVAEWREEDRSRGVEVAEGSIGTRAQCDDAGRLVPAADGPSDPVQSLCVRRVTRTEDELHPGVSGPRNWLIASPDGRSVYFPQRDPRGVVQIARADLDSGVVTAISQLSQSIENQLAIDAAGRTLTAIVAGIPGQLEIARGVWQPLLSANAMERGPDAPRFAGAVHVLPDGSGWILHGYPGDPIHSWLQLWTITLH